MHRASACATARWWTGPRRTRSRGSRFGGRAGASRSERERRADRNVDARGVVDQRRALGFWQAGRRDERVVEADCFGAMERPRRGGGGGLPDGAGGLGGGAKR